MSVLIWIQTVCKGYQQTTLVGLNGYNDTCSNGIIDHHIMTENLLKVIRPKLLSSADFFSIFFFEKHLSGIRTICVKQFLDPEQAGQNVGPDLAPN